MCRQVVESPDEKPFEASEIQIFGQLGIFKMRITKVSPVSNKRAGLCKHLVSHSLHVDRGDLRNNADALYRAEFNHRRD